MGVVVVRVWERVILKDSFRVMNCMSRYARNEKSYDHISDPTL